MSVGFLLFGVVPLWALIAWAFLGPRSRGWLFCSVTTGGDAKKSDISAISEVL